MLLVFWTPATCVFLLSVIIDDIVPRWLEMIMICSVATSYLLNPFLYSYYQPEIKVRHGDEAEGTSSIYKLYI